MIVLHLTYVTVNSEGRQCLSEFDEPTAIRGSEGKGLLYHSGRCYLLGGSFSFDYLT